MLFWQRRAGVPKRLHLFLYVQQRHVHRRGYAQIVGENFVVQGAQLLFVSGDSFLDGGVIGAFFAGKRGGRGAGGSAVAQYARFRGEFP